MRNLIRIAMLAAAASIASPALASDTEHKQQSRFAACAHDSKGLKGDEHQQFMRDCLKGHGNGDAAHARDSSHKASAEGGQQNRMKSCNEAAGRKNLHGDERRAFMSTCLKG